MKTLLSTVCLVSFCVSDCEAADVAASAARHRDEIVLSEISDPDLRSFHEIVSDTLEIRLNRRFYNRYRFGRITQATILYRDVDIAYRRLAEQAQGTLEGAVTKSLEEVLVQSPLYHAGDEWLRLHAKYVREFIKNSVASIGDEEEVRTLDTVQSDAETQWITWIKRSSDIKYGVHPSLHSPYLFVGSRVTHNKKILFVVTARYHLKSFSEHKAETVVSIPLDKRLSFSAGFVYEISDPRETRTLVRFNRLMEWGGSASVGTILNRHPQVLAEMTFPW